MPTLSNEELSRIIEEIDAEAFSKIYSSQDMNNYLRVPSDLVCSFADNSFYDNRLYLNNRYAYPPFENEKTTLDLNSDEIDELLYAIRTSCGSRCDNHTKNRLVQKLIYYSEQARHKRPATKDEIQYAYELIDSVLRSGEKRVKLYYNSFKPQVFEYVVDTLASFGVIVEGEKLDFDFSDFLNDKPKKKLGFFND